MSEDTKIRIDDSNDFRELQIELDDDSVESISHGGGVSIDLTDDNSSLDGMYVSAKNSDGFGEYAFRKYVETEYGPGTYELDLMARSVKHWSFWARVGLYGLAFLGGPFVVAMLNAGSAVAYTLGVVTVLISMVMIHYSPLPKPREAVKAQ